MDESNLALLEELTRAISSLSSSIFGEGFHLASIPPVSLHRRYSFMYRYWVQFRDGKLTPILVKIPHESWMKTLQEAIESEHIHEIVQQEFETMASIADAISESGNPNLSAIRLRAVLPAFNALLMDEIPIRMLKNSLPGLFPMFARGKQWLAFEGQLELSGQLLKVIHLKFTTGQDVPLENLGGMEKAEDSMKAIEESQKRSLGELRTLLHQLYEPFKLIRVAVTRLHDDYHLGNIFVTKDGKVGALDPNWVESGPIYADLASLIIYPVTNKMQLLTQGLAFGYPERCRYEQAVLRGYKNGFPVTRAILYLYCAIAVIEKWRDIEEVLITSDSMLRNGAYILTPWLRTYFRHLLKNYILRGLQA
jgi:hypothetical protein